MHHCRQEQQGYGQERKETIERGGDRIVGHTGLARGKSGKRLWDFAYTVQSMSELRINIHSKDDINFLAF